MPSARPVTHQRCVELRWRVVASRVGAKTHAPARQTVSEGRALTGPPRGKEVAVGGAPRPSTPLSAPWGGLFFRSPLSLFEHTKYTCVAGRQHMLPEHFRRRGWGAPLDFPS